jgi:heptosyltransferase-1
MFGTASRAGSTRSCANRVLTGLALGYVPDGSPDYGLDRARLSAVPASRYAVLLQATAQREKEWPVEHWIALGQSLCARGVQVVLPWGKCQRA